MRTEPAKTGRPLGAVSVRAQASRHTTEAVAALAAVAADVSAPADARVRAAEVLLAHATTQKGSRQ